MTFSYKMAALLENAPSGFASTVEYISSIPKEILAELCVEVMSFLQYKTGAVKTKRFHERLKQDWNEDRLQSVVNALTYLFRSAAQSKLTDSQFKQEVSRMSLISQTAASVLCDTWTSQGRSLMSSELVQQALNVGQLVDLQWKLGVAMSSDSCRNLNSPYVTLSLKVADPSGHLHTHTFEMTTTQFRNFSTQLKEIATVLETV